MKLVIVGTGNVAQVLGNLLLKANHSVLQVYGRNETTVKELAGRLQAAPVTSLSRLNKEAEVCIIATSDSAIPVVAHQISISDTVIVHTSGGVSIRALQQHPHHGVLYPLQSLRKELPYLPKIPFFIDGNSEAVTNVLTALAQTISGEVHIAGDAERLKLHIAAVFCSNFTNHLYALTAQYCNSEQLHFDYLMPLIEETVHRMRFDAPANLQTGPAIRNDEVTIQRHLHLLQAYPQMERVYKLLTKSIQSGEALR